MAYPISGSSLNSRIHTGLSTQIVVLVGDEPVGAIQDLNITQTRSLYRARELGLDGILEVVPNNSTEYQATITRIVFDRLRLPEAFSRGFVNIKSQLVPFDIEILDRSGGAQDSGSDVVHKLVSCWFNTYNPRYQANDFIISESATIYFEDIQTFFGGGASLGGADNSGARGIRGITPTDQFEREAGTDSGQFRGTLDVDDLINLTDPDQR